MVANKGRKYSRKSQTRTAEMRTYSGLVMYVCKQSEGSHTVLKQQPREALYRKLKNHIHTRPKKKKWEAAHNLPEFHITKLSLFLQSICSAAGENYRPSCAFRLSLQGNIEPRQLIARRCVLSRNCILPAGIIIFFW